MSGKPRIKVPRVLIREEDETWTDEELRLLASVAGSALQQVLSRVFKVLRDSDRARLLDPRTDLPATNFARGRLSMLADLMHLLDTEAPDAYQRRKSKGQRPEEPRP